jgi:hypothetical protein
MCVEVGKVVITLPHDGFIRGSETRKKVQNPDAAKAPFTLNRLTTGRSSTSSGQNPAEKRTRSDSQSLAM